MKMLFTISLSFLCLFSSAQGKIDWDGTYQLQLSDFKSRATRIGYGDVYSLYPTISVDFLFSMTRAEFMFTKNFNSKVSCSFKPEASSIVAPDSSTALALVEFARYQFDLSELYARRFRKALYENKNGFSGIEFFRPIYDTLQVEMNSQLTTDANATAAGKDTVKTAELIAAVRKEIDALADFCNACKPPKKSKR